MTGYIVRRLISMVLMLSSMLHSIGVGNMLPSWVRMVCVDINPAVVTKLADRGSSQTIGIVTDVGLFLHHLAQALLRRPAVGAHHGEVERRAGFETRLRQQGLDQVGLLHRAAARFEHQAHGGVLAVLLGGLADVGGGHRDRQGEGAEDEQSRLAGPSARHAVAEGARVAQDMGAEIIDINELRRQLDHVRTLRFGLSEISYLRGMDVYGRNMFSEDYLAFLKQLRLPAYDLTVEDGQFVLTFTGPWAEVSLWETIALSIISEPASR